MKSFLSYFSFSLSIMLAIAVMASSAFADCKEFKMVELEDRVEVVCVGEPPTPAQLKARAEEEKRQEAETKRQKSEEDKRKDSENGRQKAVENKRQKGSEPAAAKRKPQEEPARNKQDVKPAPQKLPFEKSGVTIQKL
jgi:Skp family chaperone for outer membrane proteins